MRELEIPHGVFETDDGMEFVRFWVAGGEDHVTLNIGAMGEDEVKQWGMILADLSVHIIRGLKQDGSPEGEDVLRSKIEQAYINRLARGDAHITGSLLGTRQ